MEGHLQTSMEVWVDNNNNKLFSCLVFHKELSTGFTEDVNIEVQKKIIRDLNLLYFIAVN